MRRKKRKETWGTSTQALEEATTYENRAEEALDEGHVYKAISNYTRAYNCMKAGGNRRRARSTFKKLKKICKKEAKKQIKKERKVLAIGLLEEARNYTEAIRLAESTKHYSAAGDLYEKIGKEDKAKIAYKKQAKIDEGVWQEESTKRLFMSKLSIEEMAPLRSAIRFYKKAGDPDSLRRVSELQRIETEREKKGWFFVPVERWKKGTWRKIKKRKRKLESRVSVVLLLSALGVGLYYFFSNPNITGNVVASLSGVSSSFISLILISVLVLVIYYYNK